jgi:ubiquinone/menaquinone biosynthesis C-methylase UbiE
VAATPVELALDDYWDPEMAQVLDTWGEGNAWDELDRFLGSKTGRILDIACGTGIVMERLGRISSADIHGCDISDALLKKAVERGISESLLVQCDATKMPYGNDAFDHAYSIGSLEHFTSDGISQVVEQTSRIVTGSVWHMVPVSRSDRDEGWVVRFQSYFNNSINWWVEKCKVHYAKVEVLDSSWSDDISVGKWFVCTERRNRA